MRETKVEQELKKYCELLGGMCIKLFPDSQVGIPDRLCILPFSCIIFIETKVGKNDLSRIQRYVHKILKRLGFPVYTCYNPEECKHAVDVELKRAQKKALPRKSI